MPFDGNGNWVSNFNAEEDRDNNIKILASRFDGIFIADIQQSFENCLTKDMQIKPQGNFDANSNRVINVSDPVNNNDAANKQSVASAVSSAISTMLGTLYPVGSIYITTRPSCPMSSLISGSTWVLVGTGKALWCGNGTAGNGSQQAATVQSTGATNTIKAGLPNITGTFEPLGHNNDTPTSGAFYKKSAGNGQGDYNNNGAVFGFDASRSSSVYNSSVTTVQPPAYVVNVWRRTA